MYYSTIVTFVRMPHDDPGKTKRPYLRMGCHNHRRLPDTPHHGRNGVVPPRNCNLIMDLPVR
jgi:hypothetical protein